MGVPHKTFEIFASLNEKKSENQIFCSCQEASEFKMGRRKQPDRQVKKKREIEMPEDLDITKRKRKLEKPRTEAKFKMAPRKQPDRQVKKKRKLEMPENLYLTKRKRKLELEEPRNFDIIGTLVCNYGMTGENLVRKIFSYMDVSSLQGGYLVSKTWNFFLINDRKLWMDILRQTHPYFEFLSRQLLSDEDYAADAKTKIWKEYFDFIEENDKICCLKIIQLFKRIQMIQVVFQDVIKNCPVYEFFQKEFIGEKLAGEIQLQIDYTTIYTFVEKEKHPKWGNNFKLDVARLLEQIADLHLNVRREEIRSRKENNNVLQFDQEHQNLYQEWLELSRKDLKVGKELLLRTALATLFGVCRCRCTFH